MDNFCKYFAEDKPRYTLEEIAAKREKVIKMVQDRVGKRITVANIRDVMTPEMMMKIIDKIDAEFFEDKLQRAFASNSCVLSACVENRCTRVAGRCHFRQGYGDVCNRITIKMMSKVFIESFKKTNIKQRAVDSVKCNDILECFILTFEHELTHAIIFCQCREWDKTNSGAGDWTGVTRPGNGHAKTFMSILFNVFGHTTYTHNLRDGMRVLEDDEREYKLDELSVGDKVIVNVRIKGEKEPVKFLAVITNINKRRKVKNNIDIWVEDGDRKGDRYIISARHIVKKIGDEVLPKVKAKTPTPPKVTMTKTQKKPKTPSPPKSKPKTVKKTTKSKLGDTLLKNLNVGDEVIMNARLPGESARSSLLVKIIELNRRKKTKQVRVMVLDDGEYKGKTFRVSPELIVANPDNPLLPASPVTGRKEARKYFTFGSLPLTRKPTDFDKDMGNVNINEISTKLIKKINDLSKYRWPKDKSPNDFFPEGFKIKPIYEGYYFLALLDNGDLVLGDTAGSEYMRYGLRLDNWREVISDHAADFKEIWPMAQIKKPNVPEKAKVVPNVPVVSGNCTKRNPDPPCGPGMVERRRGKDESGPLCCYKDTKTKKKTPPKPKSTMTKTVKAARPTSTSKCNKRNPAPPCAPGMVERARPNGEICCYKGKK